MDEAGIDEDSKEKTDNLDNAMKIMNNLFMLTEEFVQDNPSNRTPGVQKEKNSAPGITFPDLPDPDTFFESIVSSSAGSKTTSDGSLKPSLATTSSTPPITSDNITEAFIQTSQSITSMLQSTSHTLPSGNNSTMDLATNMSNPVKQKLLSTVSSMNRSNNAGLFNSDVALISHDKPKRLQEMMAKSSQIVNFINKIKLGAGGTEDNAGAKEPAMKEVEAKGPVAKEPDAIAAEDVTEPAVINGDEIVKQAKEQIVQAKARSLNAQIPPNPVPKTSQPTKPKGKKEQTSVANIVQQISERNVSVAEMRRSRKAIEKQLYKKVNIPKQKQHITPYNAKTMGMGPMSKKQLKRMKAKHGPQFLELYKWTTNDKNKTNATDSTNVTINTNAANAVNASKNTPAKPKRSKFRWSKEEATSATANMLSDTKQTTVLNQQGIEKGNHATSNDQNKGKGVQKSNPNNDKSTPNPRAQINNNSTAANTNKTPSITIERNKVATDGNESQTNPNEDVEITEIALVGTNTKIVPSQPSISDGGRNPLYPIKPSVSNPEPSAEEEEDEIVVLEVAPKVFPLIDILSDDDDLPPPGVDKFGEVSDSNVLNLDESYESIRPPGTEDENEEYKQIIESDVTSRIQPQTESNSRVPQGRDQNQLKRKNEDTENDDGLSGNEEKRRNLGSGGGREEVDLLEPESRNPSQCFKKKNNTTNSKNNTNNSSKNNANDNNNSKDNTTNKSSKNNTNNDNAKKNNSSKNNNNKSNNTSHPDHSSEISSYPLTSEFTAREETVETSEETDVSHESGPQSTDVARIQGVAILNLINEVKSSRQHRDQDSASHSEENASNPDTRSATKPSIRDRLGEKVSIRDRLGERVRDDDELGLRVHIDNTGEDSEIPDVEQSGSLTDGLFIREVRIETDPPPTNLPEDPPILPEDESEEFGFPDDVDGFQTLSEAESVEDEADGTRYRKRRSAKERLGGRDPSSEEEGSHRRRQRRSSHSRLGPSHRHSPSRSRHRRSRSPRRDRPRSDRYSPGRRISAAVRDSRHRDGDPRHRGPRDESPRRQGPRRGRFQGGPAGGRFDRRRESLDQRQRPTEEGQGHFDRSSMPMPNIPHSVGPPFPNITYFPRGRPPRFPNPPQNKDLIQLVSQGDNDYQPSPIMEHQIPSGFTSLPAYGMPQSPPGMAQMPPMTFNQPPPMYPPPMFMQPPPMMGMPPHPMRFSTAVPPPLMGLSIPPPVQAPTMVPAPYMAPTTNLVPTPVPAPAPVPPPNVGPASKARSDPTDPNFASNFIEENISKVQSNLLTAKIGAAKSKVDMYFEKWKENEVGKSSRASSASPRRRSRSRERSRNRSRSPRRRTERMTERRSMTSQGSTRMSISLSPPSRSHWSRGDSPNSRDIVENLYENLDTDNLLNLRDRGDSSGRFGSRSRDSTSRDNSSSHLYGERRMSREMSRRKSRSQSPHIPWAQSRNPIPQRTPSPPSPPRYDRSERPSRPTRNFIDLSPVRFTRSPSLEVIEERGRRSSPIIPERERPSRDFQRRERLSSPQRREDRESAIERETSQRRSTPLLRRSPLPFEFSPYRLNRHREPLHLSARREDLSGFHSNEERQSHPPTHAGSHGNDDLSPSDARRLIGSSRRYEDARSRSGSPVPRQRSRSPVWGAVSPARSSSSEFGNPLDLVENPGVPGMDEF